ncbi:M28 family peptidase [Tamlana sp. 2201CG12-4]|uniref:M28 family peptidase n=1 Tax=Tamlana sp. 2201CG12-4 TaxID=3112582 RepID=UPI002DB78DAD|nr:M28 family peptidase [Tamlana sp. 2201CG12-4]MEC3906549.1 M28 family peptidase [Tamlana sp. 2201CG12-4]
MSSDAFEGRRTGTPGALKAQKFIINQFHSLNVAPLGNSYKQLFSFFEDRRQYGGTNILGFIKGTECPKKYIVISAHYDHEGIQQGEIYNGADDNASGVSALFAFAEFFKNNPPKHSVILAAFDGEELGLQGSRYFVNSSLVKAKKIILNLNMDMISRSDKKELFVAGASEHHKLKKLIKKAKHAPGIKLLMGHDGYDGLDNWTYASDHANFHKKGIPFLYFGVEDHEDYHEPTDTYDKINPEFYIEAVKTIISVFSSIDNSDF